MTVESQDVAHAYEELAKAEAQAAALERMLDLLETRMDLILAETQVLSKEQDETPTTSNGVNPHS